MLSNWEILDIFNVNIYNVKFQNFVSNKIGLITYKIQ